MSSEKQPKRQRHLMDPSAPRPQTTPEDLARLKRVQQWVASVLVVTTVLHLVAGLIVGAFYLPEDRMDARLGLMVLAAAFGVLGIVGAFAIHGRRLLSWWLLLGVVPSLIGIYFLYR